MNTQPSNSNTENNQQITSNACGAELPQKQITTSDLQAMREAFNRVNSQLDNEQRLIMARACVGASAHVFMDKVQELNLAIH